MTKSELLAELAEAAEALGWTEVEIQRLACLTKPYLERLLVTFRQAVIEKGPSPEDK